MKTAEAFETFYNTELVSKLRDLETERQLVSKKRRQALVWTILIAAAPPLLLIGILSATHSDVKPFVRSLAPFCFGYIALCAWIYRQFFTKTLKAFTRKFKREIISKVVSFVDENLHFNQDGNIDERTFNRSSIFTQEPVSYQSEDSVRGTLGQTRIKFAEIDSKISSGKSQQTLFKGLFFLADFPKQFNTRTVVVPDAYGRDLQVIGQFFQKMSRSRDPLVKLEDPEFEHYFAVFSKDQVEARYILSTSLMARIVDFRKKTGITISLAFRDNRIYLALPLDKNLFEPSIDTSLVDFRPLKEYFQYICLMTGIVDDLNLNTRIWTNK